MSEVVTPARRHRPRHPSTLRLVIAANAAVLALAIALLASTPLTVSWPANLRGGLILGVAILATVAVQAFLAKLVLAPLGSLWQLMQAVDPLAPGQRIGLRARTTEVADLVDAFNAMLDRLEEERRQSARRAQAAQDAERRWLSLELHDQIGQELTALLLGIGVARNLEGDRQAAALEAALTTATECLEHVRTIVDHLRPAVLDDLGLVSALVHVSDRCATAGGLALQRHFAPGLPRLSDEAELGVFRVAQESLTNVVRHARAQNVSLRLLPHAGGVRLVVEDDGVGPGAPGRPPGGSGVRGMRERALLLGATLELAARHPRGTRVTMDVPFTEMSAADDHVPPTAGRPPF